MLNLKLFDLLEYFLTIQDDITNVKAVFMNERAQWGVLGMILPICSVVTWKELNQESAE